MQKTEVHEWSRPMRTYFIGLISGIQPVRVWIKVNSPISPQTSDTTLRNKHTKLLKKQRQKCNKAETPLKQQPIVALALLSNGTCEVMVSICEIAHNMFSVRVG